MSDVRLTATNPEDSSVVPVACNDRGELLLQEPTVNGDDYVEKAGDHMTGPLTLGPEAGTDNITLSVDGTCTFAGGSSGFVADINRGGLQIERTYGGDATGRIQVGKNDGWTFAVVPDVDDAATRSIELDWDGSAFFTNSVQTTTAFIVDSRQDESDTRRGVIYVNARGSANVFSFSDYNSGSQVSTFSVSRSGNGAFSGRLNVGTTGTFGGDVIVGSRGTQWMIVESNGLAHLVEQTATTALADKSDDDPDAEAGDPAPITYPPLRDIPGELTMVEQQLQKVLEKLRMIPEAGWEVWDGSD